MGNGEWEGKRDGKAEIYCSGRRDLWVWGNQDSRWLPTLWFARKGLALVACRGRKTNGGIVWLEEGRCVMLCYFVFFILVRQCFGFGFVVIDGD